MTWSEGGCGLTPKWESSLPAREVSFEEVLASRIVSRSLDFGERAPDEVPELPTIRNLRPCCAFGVDLKVKLGAVPVPFFQLTNILDAHQVGVHRYDAGFFPPASDPLKREKNGLVYTCRGGFIDIAHVRDYADRTLFLAAAIARTLREGTRRTLDTGRWIEPWLVTRSHWSSEVEDAVERYCQGDDKPELLRQVDRVGDIVFADHATPEIDVGTDLDDDFPFSRPGTRIITERDFPWVMRQIRQENAVEFGDDADRPEVLQAIGGSPIETD